MLNVTIIKDNTDPNSREEFTAVTDVCALLIREFPQGWPETAHIYHGNVCQGNDVTPSSEEEIERLNTLEGELFVIVFPGIQALPYIVAVILAVAAYVLQPGVPNIAQAPAQVLNRNQQAASPNNELSNRTNQPRINGRIPDIYGTVRSTPDLIAAPYKIFENNREVEYAYMCIGRGPYVTTDIRDGDTLAEKIPGTSVMVFAPYTSPNQYDPNVALSGDPELTIGELRRVSVLTTSRSNSVNGQVLRPPNEVTWAYTDDGQTRFRFPNFVENDGVHDFTQFFVEGDTITVTGAAMDGSPITSRIAFIAAKGDLVYNFSGGSKTFVLGVGAILFPAVYASILASIFGSAGSTWSIATESVTSVGDITGTYTTRGTPGVQGPSNPAEQAAGVPSYFIVKIVNPDSVNASWNAINAGSRGIDYHSNFTYTSSPFNVDLNGDYIITSVTSHTMTLDNPAATSSDWTGVMSTELVTPFLNVTMVSAGTRWVGPFILEDPKMTNVFANFVASNGIYRDDGTSQFALAVTVELELTPVDSTDTPIGDPELFPLTLNGSQFLKETVADTLDARPTFFGRCQIRARRITEASTDDGQVVDEVRWRDAYSVAPVVKTDFGNVTTVFSVTLATASALAVKERKLNMLVQRRIPTFDGTNLTTTLDVSNDAPLILAAICRDKYIGNRREAELDLTNFFATADAAETYFGTSVVREFSYTFDKDNISFEEMVNTVARAMFSVAYRRGSKIRLSFEHATSDSVLLFNHRNKVPGTEKRAINFGGAIGDYDGIEYTYVDPVDDSVTTIFLPIEFAATNPKKIESIGIRDRLQAYFQAWRAWNRIQFQNTSVEFEALHEADLLIINDRILVADSTRPAIQDGDVHGVSSTTLTLSQEVDLTADPPYTIFLQHYDGSTEALGITAGSETNEVVLAGAPALSLVTDKRMVVRTGYLIVGNTDPSLKAFLVSEKTPEGPMTSTVRAINYDAGYYANDLDYINALITLDGYGETGGFTPGTGTGYLPHETDVARLAFAWAFIDHSIWLADTNDLDNSTVTDLDPTEDIDTVLDVSTDGASGIVLACNEDSTLPVMLFSTDAGATWDWVLNPYPSGGRPRAIAFGPTAYAGADTFVVVGGNSQPRAAYSTNTGAGWVDCGSSLRTAIGSSGFAIGVDFVATELSGVFLCGISNGNIARSFDGQTWTSVASGIGGTSKDLACFASVGNLGAGSGVILGLFDGRLVHSTDNGSTWASTYFDAITNADVSSIIKFGLAWGNDTFVAVLRTAAGAPKICYSINDGLESPWPTGTVPTLSPAIYAMNDVVWSPTQNLFLATASTNGTTGYILSSPDGATWTLEKTVTLAGASNSGSLALFNP